MNLQLLEQLGPDATIQDWMAADATSRKAAAGRRAFFQWLGEQEAGSRFGESECTAEAVSYLARHEKGGYARLWRQKRVANGM
jgi:hypothetical protein